MATEDLETVVVVCSQGRGKERHAGVSLSALEERTRVEDTVAVAAAAVAP